MMIEIDDSLTMKVGESELASKLASLSTGQFARTLRDGRYVDIRELMTREDGGERLNAIQERLRGPGNTSLK